MSRTEKAIRLFNMALVLICSVVFIAPLWFMFSGSFIEYARILYMPPQFFPENPTLRHYAWVFNLPGFWIWTLNTIIVTLGSMIPCVIISAMVGYVFSFHRLKNKKIFWLIFLAGAFLPRMSMLIPLFIVAGKLGISGTMLSVILPGWFSPGNIYLARNYFDTIPKSLIDSARIDGASEWQIIRYVVLPVSLPVVAVMGIGSGLAVLGDYIWQSLQLQGQDVQTLLVGLTFAATRFGPGVQMEKAGIAHSLTIGVFLLFPMLVIFLLANKYFVSSLGGAIKE